MTSEEISVLAAKPLSILRLTDDEWERIESTRRQGVRFSLNFPHEMVPKGLRGGLVLVAIGDPPANLRLGYVRSVAATSTLDTRLSFDLVQPVRPVTLDALLGGITSSALKSHAKRLSTDQDWFQKVSEKLGAATVRLLAAIPENAPALAQIAAQFDAPKHYSDARALQQDALTLALKAFGGDPEVTKLTVTSKRSALATVRVLEDAAIEHDARWIPGWHLEDSDLTGRAVFKRDDEQLEVFTANKRPLERIFGVDLIYLNVARKALVMVQYKMLEPKSEDADGAAAEIEGEWQVTIDDQFRSELDRMRGFDQDLDVEAAYRLHPGAFFFKLLRRNSSTKAAGIIISLGHLDHLLNGAQLNGPRGGLRIDYQSLDGHYLRTEPFVDLVRSGYVGTRGATTSHMQALINASLQNNTAVVAAIQSAIG